MDVVEGLRRFLADSAVVYFKTHGYHWNVEGANFFSLHQMLEVFYTDLWESLDLLAERIRALGEKAPISYSEMVQFSSIKEMEGVVTSDIMLDILHADYVALASLAKKVSDLADKADDRVSADMLNARMEILEKNAWMIQASNG